MLHKKHENRLVELALEYLDSKNAEQLYIKKKNGGPAEKAVASATVGKVASFGPTVIQIGLKPTILFYQQDENRKAVSNALHEILQMAAEDKELRGDLAICRSFAKKAENKTLLDSLNDIDKENTKDENEKHAELVEARELICAASTALKWALRSLDVKKTEED